MPALRRLSPVMLLAVSIALASTAGGCGNGSSGSGTTSLDPPATVPDPPGDVPAFPFIDHLDQSAITAGQVLFEELFVIGDELFETAFTGLDGSGIAELPDGTPLPHRFSRVPPGGGRFTGPNGQACVACHNVPFGTSAGEAAGNVAQDPAGLGAPPFNLRNATSLFGSAVLQRLAEEITENLLAIRDEAASAAAPGGPPATRALAAKGISYGEITATRDASGVVTFDTSGVDGVDADLVVRPYGWKGNVTTLRDFVRTAARNELGMEADELVAKDPLARSDPDGDGIENEFSIGDITAVTIYIGTQEIPTTTTRLVSESLRAPPAAATSAAAERGAQLFETLGCAGCHLPELHLEDPVFEEPTRRGGGFYFDTAIDPVATNLDPDRPFKVHLVQQGDFPRLLPADAGGARASLFGDLKRHNMGALLADAQPTSVNDARGEPLVLGGSPVEVAESVFLTAELWGVGSTGPWLHDGRAGTLREAILLHGAAAPPPIGDPARSEAQEARDEFAALSEDDAAAVVEFLKSLVLFELPAEE